MGRKMRDIKKIEEARDRKICFYERFPGLIKKAYELSVLSNSDVALITRHPSKNNLCYFSHPKRAEDVFIKFLNMPDDVRKINGQECRERLVIPNKDSLIAKLQNCKIQDDTAAAEEIIIEQGNSKAITSGDDSRSIQHTEVINPQEFPHQILDYQRFHQTATPMTPEHLFDEYGGKLAVILSHIQQRKMLLQQQELMQTNACFANLQLQQQATINSMQFYQGIKQETQEPRFSLKEPGAFEPNYSVMYPPLVPAPYPPLVPRQFPPRPHDHEASGSQSHDFTTQATNAFSMIPPPATYPDTKQEDAGDSSLPPRNRHPTPRDTHSDYA